MSYPVLSTLEEVQGEFLQRLAAAATPEMQNFPHELSRPASVALARILQCLTGVPLLHLGAKETKERLEIKIAGFTDRERELKLRHTYIRYYTGDKTFYFIDPLANPLYFGLRPDMPIETRELPTAERLAAPQIEHFYGLKTDYRGKILARERILHSELAFTTEIRIGPWDVMRQPMIHLAPALIQAFCPDWEGT